MPFYKFLKNILLSIQALFYQRCVSGLRGMHLVLSQLYTARDIFVTSLPDRFLPFFGKNFRDSVHLAGVNLHCLGNLAIQPFSVFILGADKTV